MPPVTIRNLPSTFDPRPSFTLFQLSWPLTPYYFLLWHLLRHHIVPILVIMKVSWLGWSLLSSLAVPTVAASSQEGNRLVKRLGWGSSGVDPETPSVFNGLDVPPLIHLTPDNFEEYTKDGTWSVSLSHYRRQYIDTLLTVPGLSSIIHQLAITAEQPRQSIRPSTSSTT